MVETLQTYNSDGTIEHFKKKFSSSLPPSELEYLLFKGFNNAKATFDASKGAGFATHLSNHLQRLYRDAESTKSSLKTSEGSLLKDNKVLRAKDELYMRFGTEPSNEEIAKHLKMPLKDISKSLRNSGRQNVKVKEYKSKQIQIDVPTLLPSIKKDEQKIADTIAKGMNLQQSLKHTGMSKSEFYRQQGTFKDKLRQSYLRTAERES